MLFFRYSRTFIIIYFIWKSHGETLKKTIRFVGQLFFLFFHLIFLEGMLLPIMSLLVTSPVGFIRLISLKKKKKTLHVILFKPIYKIITTMIKIRFEVNNIIIVLYPWHNNKRYNFRFFISLVFYFNWIRFLFLSTYVLQSPRAVVATGV